MFKLSGASGNGDGGENQDIDATVPGQNGLTGRQYASQVLAKYNN